MSTEPKIEELPEDRVKAEVEKFPETFMLDGKHTCRISKLYSTAPAWLLDGAVWVRVDLLKEDGTWDGWFVEEAKDLLANINKEASWKNSSPCSSLPSHQN